MAVNGVLAVKDLHTYFYTREGVVKAVNGVSFTLRPESILGLVGESGCGKTVTALSILRIVPYPGRIVRGEVHYNGTDLLTLDSEELRKIRGRDIAMVFQDPVAGLNPVLPVGVQVEEMVTSHLQVSRSEAKTWAIRALRRVGLPDPARLVAQYPFQLSGGMCQRVMLAIAMALDPKVLIADEATSNLDVTIQAEVLRHIQRLKEQRHASVILITHNLGVVAQMAEEVAVMYAGSIVEYARTTAIFQRPAHPYTWALLQALPRPDTQRHHLVPLKGTPPDLINPPDQCLFLPRCPKAINDCRLGTRPPLRDVDPGHLVACYNPVRHDWD